MKHAMLAALAGAMLLASAPAIADPTIDDVHCLIVYIQLVSSADAGLKTAGTFGQLYWLGKLDGESPGMDLEGRILAELPIMRDDMFQAEAKRCGNELIARGAAEAAMGKDMQQKGAALEQQEKSN